MIVGLSAVAPFYQYSASPVSSLSQISYQGGLPSFADAAYLPLTLPVQSSTGGFGSVLLMAAVGGLAYWYFVYRKKNGGGSVL